MKKVILLLILVFFISINFVYAACNYAEKQDDWCFGTEVYGQRCNGTEWENYVKGDCGIVGQICRKGECVTEDKCDINSDCNDNNACTIDSCIGDSIKRCEYIIERGCEFNGRCIPIGTRLTDADLREFCEFDGILLEQKKDKETCNNGYECESNLCNKGICDSGFSDNIISFILAFILITNLLILFALYKRKR